MMENPSLLPEKTLKDYWQTLVRRRWVVATFFVITVAVVVLNTFLMTPLFRAESTVIIEGENSNVRAAEEATTANQSLESFENYLDTQIALIKSDLIAGKVAAEFKLRETPRYRKRVGIKKIFRKTFLNDLYIEQVKGSRMIRVSVENPDAKLAADLANRLVELYSKENLTRRALTFIRNQRMASLNDEFLRLHSKLDNLSTRFGPKHPEMIALRNEIRTLSDRIERERYAASHESVEQAVERDQTLLEDALLKIQESSVFASQRMNNIGIVDKAAPPTEPSKPKKALNIALGVVAGLIGGILLAYLVDYLDDTIKTEEDLKRHIGKIQFFGSIFEQRGGLGSEKGYEKLVALVADSPSVEAYRLVRMNVLWHATREGKLRDFTIVSPGPGEGKTTVSSNLAIALAQSGQKILFVDTDFRRGRIHEIYGLEKKAGLGEYLTEGMKLDDVAHASEVPNLTVIPCGRSAIDSSLLLASSRMAEFIRESRQRFDMILYDTPPVTIISDAAILMSQIDGALLSVRCGFTNARVLSRALTLISESKTRLFGVVLNGVTMNDSAGYNKYYKQYYYKKPGRRSS